MKLRALIFAAALAACGQTGEKGQTTPEPTEAPDPFALQIEIGRYGYMLYQTHELTAERSGAQETEPSEPRALARSLREVVWRYNLERSTLCARGLFTDVACGPVYEPVWISEPADATVSLEELQTRASAIGDEVLPFWEAVCEDAKTTAADEEARSQICPME
jgi:hypothetical protein